MRISIYLVWGFFFLDAVYNYNHCQWQFKKWDMLLLTGLLAFILGLNSVLHVDDWFETVLRRLVDRMAISLQDPDVKEFSESIKAGAQTWSQAAALLLALGMVVAFGFSLAEQFRVDKALLAIPQVVGAYMGGCYMGRMAYYGRLCKLLERRGVEFRLQPLHVDGAAGLKPVGDFYFRQAMIAAIPVAHLGIWVLLFPFWPRYTWAKSYLMLLVVALIVEMLTFFAPMIAFHRTMRRKKRAMLTEADRMSLEIDKLHNEPLVAGEPAETRNSRIESLKARYWAIENMPTWPVDLSTQKRFNRINVILILPLVTRLVDENTRLGSMVKIVAEQIAKLESN